MTVANSDAYNRRNMDTRLTFPPDQLPTQPRAVSILAIDRPAGHVFPAHTHRRGQLVHAISGVLVVRAAQGSWVVPTDRAVWLPSKAEHEVSAASNVKIRAVYVEPDARPALPQSCRVVAVSTLLRELIIRGASMLPGALAAAHEQRILDLILDEIEVAPALPLHVPIPRHAGLSALCTSLLEQPSMEATIADHARRLGMNERTFTRLFKRETGMTFGVWLRHARLLLSLPALARGASILSVALDHGYDSPSAFAAAFRRTFGLPPSTYQAQRGVAE
ncbi:AraC family transcriptional regulator [Collimonas sp. NPDC087041]|uniref:AraC family transcriptional regulator n=1 Tax=Collimonas sp. NPDC087041 TaxID=3363960 RepID=UPI003811B519